VIKHGQEKRPFLKYLIPCLHFSKNFKNLENLGGVKLKHLLEIQNTSPILQVTGFFQPITALYSALPRDFAKRQCKLQWLTSPTLSSVFRIYDLGQGL